MRKERGERAMRRGEEEGRRRRNGERGNIERGGREIVEGGREVGYVNDVDVMFVYFNYLFSL